MRHEEKQGFHLIEKFSSIRGAILSSYFLVALVSLAVFAVVALHYTEKTVLENAEEYSIQLIQRVNSDIDSYMDYLYNISILITSDRDVHDYLFKQGQNAEESYERYERISSQFETIMETRNDIVNIGILGGNEDYLLNSGRENLNPNVELETMDWICRTKEKKGMTEISSSHVQNLVAGHYEWVITLSKAIQNRETQAYEGIFFVDLNFSSISELCDAISFGNRGYVYILDGEGNLIYHPQQQLLYSGLKQECIGEIISCQDNSFVTEDGKLYAISRSEETGWTVVGVSYVEELLKNNAQTTRIYLISAVLILLAATALAFFLSNEITKPIKALRDSMGEAEKGNFDHAAMEIRGTHEIARLNGSFNIMIQEIRNLMEQNVQEQRQKRKSELKALQAQINPHFLYNTLDSIIWMAEWGKTKEVVTMTSALAKLLRQSISNQNELVRVEEEAEYTRSYLTIQKMRYKDKLEYEIRMEPKLLDLKVPKLILQPLVENAIYHGIKYKEGKGTVLIEGDYSETEVILKVTDDGIGMDETQLSKIFEKKEPTIRKSGVGVLNVHERLQLYYGKNYGLTFFSTPGEGTTAEIHIPITEGGTGINETV